MKTLLFICTGNYYRSRFAELLFNHHALKSGIDWRAVSRGIAVDLGAGNEGPISGNAVHGLARRGIFPTPPLRSPQQATDADLDAADRIIALDESEHRPMLARRYPGWEKRVDYWQIPDVGGMHPDEAMAEMELNVIGLIEGLGGRTTG